MKKNAALLLIAATLAATGCAKSSTGRGLPTYVGQLAPNAPVTTRSTTPTRTTPGSTTPTPTRPTTPTTPTAPPAPSTPGAFEIVDFKPTSAPATQKDLTFIFSKPVEPSSLVFQTTWLAAEDDDTTPGGQYHLFQGTLDLDAAGTTATFKPTNPFSGGKEVRFVFTTQVISTSGDKLAKGNKSGPLSFTQAIATQIFESVFTPMNGTGPIAAGPIPGPTQAPTTPAPLASVAGAFEVVRTTPTAGAANDPVPTTIFVEFSMPVDKSTLVGGTNPSITVLQATSSATTFSFPKFGIRWANNDTRLEIVPDPLFSVGPDMFVCLGSYIKSTTGVPLTKGTRSSPLTKKTWVSNQVFELTFKPNKVPTPAAPTNPAAFQLQAGTDPWFLDFDLRAAQFLTDMQRHGLMSGDQALDQMVKERIMAGVLSTMSLKYGRTADGQGQPGAWKISFTAVRPSGTPGKTFNREAIGGFPPSSGTLGISTYDVGNNSKDDNAGPGSGIFAGVIFGEDSKLDPLLKAADKKFLDGTYTPGTSAADDARQARILAVIDDWSRSLGSVCAHEVGHSVGLSHVDDQLSIMDSRSTSSQLSEPRLYFYPSSSSLLDANLGRQ